MKILFADDLETNRFLVTHSLERHGHNVKTVTDGRQVLKWLEMFPPPDLVITDYNMPQMDGLEVLQCIRVDERFKFLRVFVYTTNEYPEFKSEVERLGGVLVKKVISELVAAVNAIAAEISKERG